MGTPPFPTPGILTGGQQLGEAEKLLLPSRVSDHPFLPPTLPYWVKGKTNPELDVELNVLFRVKKKFFFLK